MGVSQLGYLGLNVSDPDAWLDLMANVFGLEVRERKGKESLEFRVDDHHHRLALYRHPADSHRELAEVPCNLTAGATAEFLARISVDSPQVSFRHPFAKK